MTNVEGAVAPGFERVRDAFAANFAQHGDIGAACCVYRDGEAVVDVWGGLSDRADARPWTRDTVVIVFSCTKGVTAVAANQLIERGLLDPDAPVAEYWPEFAQQGKGTVLVSWVLSHRAGLAAIDTPDLTLDDVAAWDPVVDAIAAQAPNWEPGTTHGYHARTYGWITGELIRRITGLMPGAYVAQEIADPLGLDFVIGVPESWEPRVATLYPPVYDDPDVARLADEALHDTSTLLGRVMSGPSGLFGYDDMWNTRRMRAAQLPSSNGHGDARALARMYAACLDTVDGVRLLAPGTVARATDVRSPSSLAATNRMNLSNIFYTQAIGNPVDMMTSLAFLLAGGVCERFPDLTIIVLETNGGWITPWMERLDHHWKTFGFDVPDCKLAPSEYFRRQCYISFDADEETLGLAAESPYVGNDRIIWASDYPHPDAKFPGTVGELLDNIAGLDAGAQENIAWRNAQRLYGLPAR